MWQLIMTLSIQILGLAIKKHSNDEETNKKFFALADHIQSKRLSSAQMKVESENRLENLRKQTED